MGAESAVVASEMRPVEATSLLGEPLLRPALTAEFSRRQEELLASALADATAEPEAVEHRIWIGRRTAYLGRYREAVEIYGAALEIWPDEPRLYRHRGHRLITLRRLEEAVADLERAATLVVDWQDEIEPDGLPNARNIPTSTLKSNIYYHLGLAHYLQGDFESALDAYRSCLEVSPKADMRVATLHWLYMTLRRLGRAEEALTVIGDVTPDLEIIENHDYFELILGYRSGEPPAKAGDEGVGRATRAYGVGNWHLYNGRLEPAFEIFSEILAGDSWAAFGFIAAEAEVARRPEPVP